MATPFQVASPWTATPYPRSRSSSPSRSRKASSASLVSCRQTTSGRRSSSQGNSRGRRCLTELTFQVAIRTDPKVPAPAGFAGSPLAVDPEDMNRRSSRRGEPAASRRRRHYPERTARVGQGRGVEVRGIEPPDLWKLREEIVGRFEEVDPVGPV